MLIADDVEQLKALFNDYKPELVINLALPYQDLTIMDACLACGCNYLDTANYEPKDEAHFEYSWQWAYKDRFEQAGLTAILGCGFDPGVSGVYTAWAAKHHFDEIEYLDIVDCNAGNHHKAFATNFNPEMNRLSLILGNANLSEESKRTKIAGMVTGIVAEQMMAVFSDSTSTKRGCFVDQVQVLSLPGRAGSESRDLIPEGPRNGV